MPTAKELTTDIVTGPGGVMTDEVGVVTGELTLHSRIVDGGYVLQVRYKDAEEWYTVTGAATKAPVGALRSLHTLATALLHRPEG